MTWNLEVDDHTTRSANADRFGGARFGGIEPAHDSDNIFVYSDPASGSEYGYDFDGWVEDEGVFRYTGDGQVGDQQLSGRNLTLLEHADRGFSVRVFVADGVAAATRNTKSQRYVGEFVVDREKPFTVEDGPDKHGDERKLIVFRMRPVGEVGAVFPATNQQPSPSVQVTTLVPVEEAHASEFTQPGIGEGTAERREAKLVKAFERHLDWLGHKYARHRIDIPESTRPLWTDIVDLATETLYEAKGAASRHNIRLAVGQLLDYQRRLEPRPANLSVLLPSEPASDMQDLLTDLGIGCVWHEPGGKFVERRVASENGSGRA